MSTVTDSDVMSPVTDSDGMSPVTDSDVMSPATDSDVLSPVTDSDVIERTASKTCARASEHSRACRVSGATLRVMYCQPWLTHLSLSHPE